MQLNLICNYMLLIAAFARAFGAKSVCSSRYIYIVGGVAKLHSFQANNYIIRLYFIHPTLKKC
jgi:hypothetical protein